MVHEIERIVSLHTSSCSPAIGQIFRGAIEQWCHGAIRSDQIDGIVDAQLSQIDASLRPEAEMIRGKIHADLAYLLLGQAEESREHRKTGGEMHREINHAFELIERKGRGIVYFGSARTKPGEQFYENARELGYEAEHLLHTPAWSGAGPGQMQAALEGTKQAGGSIAGVKIRLGENQAANEQHVSYIFDTIDDVVECDHFGPRKIGLADAGWPEVSRNERCAFVFFPGALGTLDELFEVCVLKQLKKVGDGKKICVPILLMNYDEFYFHLLEQLKICAAHGMVSREEMNRIFHVCNDNREALDFLADFHQIPNEERSYRTRLKEPIPDMTLGAGI